MYLMYVDESGDPGPNPYSKHFILSGLIVNQDEWSKYLGRLKAFRKHIKAAYDLNQRTEIHSAELIRVNKLQEYKNIHKKERIKILLEYSIQLPLIFDTAKVINVCLNKDEFPTVNNIQVLAWNRLLTRYDTYLKKEAKDKGVVISDDTDAKTIMDLLRKLRIYNPVPSHYTGTYNAPTDSILEDVFSRASHQSYFIQSVDVIAHLLYRKEYPKGSLKKHGIEKYFGNIEPILLKEAAKADPLGVVRK